MRTAGGSLQAFYPLILSAAATPLVLNFDILWAGTMLGVALLALHKTWWICIFGLLNCMAAFAMMIAFVIAWITSNKKEANKTLISTPDPWRVESLMNIQPSIQKSEPTLGQL